MPALVRLCVLLIAGFACLPARAEGNCPAGMYPIHSPGVMGCAPIPGAQPQAAPPRVEPRGPQWSNRWGAVARDMTGSEIYGVASNRRTDWEARTLAVVNCMDQGGKKCQVVTEYRNSCVFAAQPHANGVTVPGTVSVVSGGQQDTSRAKALANCEVENRTTCMITYTECSEAVAE